MAVSSKPVTLSPASQKLLATWAVKTVLLLELAFRQMYPGSRLVEGYQASQPEFAWLRARSQPPPRSLVWLGCWDCQQAIPVRYAPSSTPLPAPEGSQVYGHFATFTLGYVAFQVFTVDYVAADLHQASQWNGHVSASLALALPRIWPPLLGQQEISWPPPAFAAPAWDRLVTWEGALRRGTDGIAQQLQLDRPDSGNRPHLAGGASQQAPADKRPASPRILLTSCSMPSSPASAAIWISHRSTCSARSVGSDRSSAGSASMCAP